MKQKTDYLQHQYNFAAHIRDPSNNPAPANIEDRRMGIYRDLFFNNQVGFILNTFPVMSEILGEDRIRSLVREFFSTYPNHSPYFREIPLCFLKFFEARDNDTAYPFIKELARYEWLELHLMVHPDPELGEYLITKDENKLLNDAIQVNPLYYVEHYKYPVQHATQENAGELIERETFLIVFRDATDRVRFIEVNAFTAIFWEILKSNPGITVRSALEALAEANSTSVEQLIQQILPIIHKGMRDGLIYGVLTDDSMH